MAKNKFHGRAGGERVLISVNMLDIVAGALDDARNSLGVLNVRFPGIVDPVQREHLGGLSGSLRTLAQGKPYRPRAPKGYRTVPRGLLLEAVGAIDEGAGEFEDAASYCNNEDEMSCLAHGIDMRHTSAKLRHYTRKTKRR